MRFWDSSAIVPLLIEQEYTLRAQQVWKDVRNGDAGTPVIWWNTPIECTSALARLEREELISPALFDSAQASLRALLARCGEIQPGSILRDKALRLLRLHPIRSADAQQLAAALIASEDLTTRLEFVCFDNRLAQAARREGFSVIDQFGPGNHY